MRPFAVLSDVNANLEALSAVFNDIEAQGINDLLFLGDAIGFGPNPLECVAQLRDRVRVYLCGRLESLITQSIGEDLAQFQREGLLFSYDVLRTTPHWEWLQSRPNIYEEDKVLAVHSNPRGREYECLLLENIQFNQAAMVSIFSLFPKVLFIGDNHQPWLFTEDNQGYTEKEVNYEYRLSSKGKAIISVGSVGQPRDGDSRACYVTVSGDSVIWRRVEYDIEHTISKIEANPKLVGHFAMRLREGI